MSFSFTLPRYFAQWLVVVALVLLLLIPSTANAQQGFNAGVINAQNCLALGFAQCAADALRGGLLGLVRLALTFVGLVALIAIVVGGIMYVISVGNEDKISRAKDVILYAIIGLIVIGLSMAAVNVVANLF